MNARAAAIFLLCATTAGAASLYNLVEGLDKFNGSTPAWQLLATNGFVVTDPPFNDYFEPYLDASLPAFITVDSAWQTYSVLVDAAGRQARPKARLPAALVPWLTNGLDANIPSGLEFLAAAPELRSEAAMRILGQRPPPTAPWPDSLHADAMRLLASLERPLPKGAAPAMRTGAWADLQLWTELGLWAGELHVPDNRPKPAAGIRDDSDNPRGVVAPYPDFFAGLAQLARKTEAQFSNAGLDEAFDSHLVARKLLDGILWQENSGANPGLQLNQMNPPDIAQFDEFLETFTDAGGHNGRAALDDWETLARRCLNPGAPSDADLAVLRGFYDRRRTVPHLLDEFAAVCDRLAALARKNLDKTALTVEDEAWIGRYGATLARLNFVTVSPLEPPPDDAPLIDSINVGGTNNAIFHAALARPEALYIIIPTEGKLQLYRGSVMTYREWTDSKPLNDDAWRELSSTGNTPPPPPFTRSFYVEKSAAEILAILNNPPLDGEGMEDFAKNLEELRGRVTDRDLPYLIAALGKSRPDFPMPAGDGIAAAIAGLNWAPYQKDLLALLDKDDGQHAAVVIQVLIRRPEWLDTAYLCTNLPKANVTARRIECALLSRQPPNATIRSALTNALHDPEMAVRWQAALAMSGPGWSSEQNAGPLLEELNDTNPLVAAAAAYALGRSGATNAAPDLLNYLKTLLAGPALTEEELQKAAEPLRDLMYVLPGQTNILDPDLLAVRLRPGLRRMRRFGDPAMLQTPFDDFTPVDAIVEALGRLDYHPAKDVLMPLLDGSHATAAANALEQIAPDQLARRLTALAADKNAPPPARDEALLLLAAYPQTAIVNSLAPLLDDATVVPGRRMMPGREWRICDRAATTIATLLGRATHITAMEPAEQRDKDINEVRQWLKSAY